MRPLEGLTVLEFAQYMAGPSAGLRLADLGARVIKIERPKSGEGGRQLAIKNLFVDRVRGSDWLWPRRSVEGQAGTGSAGAVPIGLDVA